MKFELCEPVRELFKDEVRQVGALLGLPDAIVWRQPFPGPGLAVRVVGEVTEERLAILREADAIVREEIAAAGLDRQLWRWLPFCPGCAASVSPAAGALTRRLVAVRAVTQHDAMTAAWARLPWEVWAHLRPHRQGSGPGQPGGVRHHRQAPGTISGSNTKPAIGDRPSGVLDAAYIKTAPSAYYRDN